MDNSESGDEVAAFMHTAEGTYITADDEGDHVLAENSDDSAHDDTDDMKGPGQPLREQDRFLPIANVAKIMKRAIPETGKIAKDARECVQECVSEFISFITSEASDRCHMEKRKTINGEDILFAMTNLGFDNYVDPLKLYLQKYREIISCRLQKEMIKAYLDLRPRFMKKSKALERRALHTSLV
ncbi:uncharacterized protein LOC132195018 isoform X2 [Neocloeon triangulifer]|uniref:uncharacterized protein LOC132195018 isoform X2 n=1 Tax=Neocloeon triangulifer TaxID=2078957 RepID=UPI00286F4D6F|nr:uncharacterized protein LOC132195018 isoform X2 [Neocloeon triangulifer]